jgi:membrane associated rhomboid family serine protease
MRTYRAVNLNPLWFLMALCVAVFAIELVTGGGISQSSPLISFLGVARASISSQPWTILTAMFVHYDFLHILVNMISLYFLGSFFLRAAGERSFLAVFFLGGLAGNALYILLSPPNIIGIGASGAIFAIGGALAIMVPRVPVYIFFIPVATPLWVAIVIFLLLSFLPGIAWQAHLGGLLLGLIAGLILKKRRQVYYF